jgi:hypothetical protein
MDRRERCLFRTEADLDCQTKEGRLADKSNQLILEALHRAASEPAGVPLFASKKNPGLFPGGASARPAAEQCTQLGFLRPAPVRNMNGSTPEAYAITEKGLDFLLSQLSPKQVLEDLAKQFEHRQTHVQALVGSARAWLDEMASLRNVVERALQALSAQGERTASVRSHYGQESWLAASLACLKNWHAAHASGDCPLPELFRRAQATTPSLTIGQFHDGLRRLHEQQLIYLHPWTGPLYELPEPACALLVGHEIAYYASSR